MSEKANELVKTIRSLQVGLKGLADENVALRQTVDEVIKRYTSDDPEISKRGQAIFEDVYKFVFDAIILAAGQTVEVTQTVASDFDFAYLKVTGSPDNTIRPVSMWSLQIKDGSSDVILSNAFIPASTFVGAAGLPYIEVGPRKFPARGAIIVDFRDEGIAPVYPYTIHLVLHGKKIFRQRIDRAGA